MFDWCVCGRELFFSQQLTPRCVCACPLFWDLTAVYLPICFSCPYMSSKDAACAVVSWESICVCVCVTSVHVSAMADLSKVLKGDKAKNLGLRRHCHIIAEHTVAGVFLCTHTHTHVCTSKHTHSYLLLWLAPVTINCCRQEEKIRIQINTHTHTVTVCVS